MSVINHTEIAMVLIRTFKVSGGGGPQRSMLQTASARRHPLHWLVKRSHGDCEIKEARSINSRPRMCRTSASTINDIKCFRTGSLASRLSHAAQNSAAVI